MNRNQQSLGDKLITQGQSNCLFVRQPRVHDAMFLPKIFIEPFPLITEDFSSKSIKIREVVGKVYNSKTSHI